jgi:hypothetical protein
MSTNTKGGESSTPPSLYFLSLTSINISAKSLEVKTEAVKSPRLLWVYSETAALS